MEKVRIGLIGLGLMGTPHARILKKVEECDLVAASDVDEKQKRVTEELGIKFYRNYEEMIAKESVQGVILAVPNHLHAPIGIVCARRGERPAGGIRLEPLAKSPAVGQVDGMTTVARCLTIDQALFMRSLLEGCGLTAYVPDELTAQTDPVIFFGSMNSIRVEVDDNDAAAARAILA